MSARRVLVIEDEANARAALGNLLAEEGFTVCTASSGLAGLERVAGFQPDTIVCDFRLPDIDGLQVLRRVRARAAAGDGANGIVFIMVTAGCGGGDAERALRAEADHFLQKPINVAQFRRLLQRPVTHAGGETLSPLRALDRGEHYGRA